MVEATPHDHERERGGLDGEAEDAARLMDKKIRKAKRSARSELSVSKGEWTRHGFAKRGIVSALGNVLDTVPRVHCSELSVEQFVERYEQPRVPVVLTGLTERWPAAREWTPERLLSRFQQHSFKVGSDDDGYSVRLPFSYFMHYVESEDHGRADDSPLYIFDGTFAEKGTAHGLLADYQVPPYFQEDLFQHVGERRRPPYRWFVMGPARSGSGLHIDPLATSAWNALLAGHKRWALFPPGTPKELVLPKEPGLERESISWFTHMYPRTQQPGWSGPRPLDILQRPGETVFVPDGWWHAVINLDLTIAVTQNYASGSNFDRVWRHTRKGRPKMSVRWLSALRPRRPDLATRADAINEAEAVDECSESTSSSSSSSSSSSDDDSDDNDSGEGRGGSSPRCAEGGGNVGSAGVGSVSVGSVSVGNTGVGNAGVGSASVGNAGVGGARDGGDGGRGGMGACADAAADKKRRRQPDMCDHDTSSHV